MANLFVLGRLRAPYTALATEVDGRMRRLFCEAEHGVYSDSLAFIPIENTPHFPRTFKPIFEEAVGDLFIDYAIGQLHGCSLSALRSSWVDIFSGHLYLYGRNSKLLETKFNAATWKWEVTRELTAETFLEQEADEEPGLEDYPEEWEYEDGEDDDEDGDWYVSDPCNDVAGEFPTQGLVEWLTQFGEDKVSGARAQLLVLITRDDFSEFWDSKDGHKLAAALGSSATVVMESASAACIVFEREGASDLRLPTVTKLLRPRLVEDFVFLDIGLEIAAKHPSFSRLADWANERTQPRRSTRPPQGPRVLKPTRK